MKIWLDTANTKVIKKAVRMGLLAGITTNPTIIAHSQREEEEVLKDLLHTQPGPVTAQLLVTDVHEMVQEGLGLFSISNRLIIKVPVTHNGLEAIHLLSKQGVTTMATVVFTAHQALMAALAGANYVAPYISRIEKAGMDPWAILTSISKIFHHYQLKTQILGASISSLEQVIQCAEAGLYGITIKEEIFEKLVEDHPLTIECVEKFTSDSLTYR